MLNKIVTGIKTNRKLYLAKTIVFPPIVLLSYFTASSLYALSLVLLTFYITIVFDMYALSSKTCINNVLESAQLLYLFLLIIFVATFLSIAFYPLNTAWIPLLRKHHQPCRYFAFAGLFVGCMSPVFEYLYDLIDTKNERAKKKGKQEQYTDTSAIVR